MIDDSMSILKFIIPKAHICFYICSEIKYYLKKNYLYYYFIILFLEFANCFQLFISSIPIYVVHMVYGTLPFRYFALQVRCPSELCPSGTLPFTKYEG